MGVNIVKYGNQTLIDLTDTTAVASDVAQGKYFYGKDGVKTEGTATGGGGISPTARDLLDYILEHATYIQPDMQTYIDQLYIALGGTITTYTITNTLTNCSNLNTDVQINGGYPYSGALIADLGYEMDSVTVTMGDTDITSSAYDSLTGAITISNVSGNIVIVAEATAVTPVHYTGYIEVGNPTITNNILTVGDAKFIKSNQLFSPGDNTWTVRCKARRTSTLGSYGDLYGSVNSDNSSARGFLLEFSRSDGGIGAMFVSSNGTSWDISTTAQSSFPSSSNTWILYEISFTGTTYEAKYSTDDGSTWTTAKTVTSSAKLIGGYAVGFGVKRNGYYRGDVDLSECKIWIDGQLWWSAI